MIRILDLRGRQWSLAELREVVPRGSVDMSDSVEIAQTLIDDVRNRGSVALREQSEKFDGCTPLDMRVHEDDIARAVEALDGNVRAAIDESISRVRQASAAQVPPPAVTTFGPDSRVEQRWVPVGRVGLYVPGGKAVYPSSVIMNVVPAQVAGVTSMAIVSPPQRDFDGRVHPTVLATAGVLGVTEVYAMGGAGAVGALAYGVADIGLDPVDVITGPGNRFVAAAKRVVRGRVGIDAEAGPTEIAIIADSSARPALVAADLISQAEHDEMAAAVLITDDEALAREVLAQVEQRAQVTHHRERVLAALAGEQSAIVLVDDMLAALDVSNAYGPEHLEIQTRDADRVLSGVVNAGAIFVGTDSPVSLGDYLAGSNHVLPTLGQARSSSALGAYTFLRAQQVIRYDHAGLAEVAGLVRRFADEENLPAHGDAVDARFEDGT